MTGENSDGVVINLAVSGRAEENESYFQLVWRRFRRSTVSIIGALMVLMLVILAIFADFFSPTSISEIDLQVLFHSPAEDPFY